MFKNSKLKKALKIAKRKRIRELANELDDIVFLDFDGVINLDTNNYTGPFINKELINNVNKLCLKYNLKIVVSSSWRKSTNYKNVLYSSGLSKDIKILGHTEVLEKDRESEMLKYIETNPYINKFIILDDGKFNELERFQVKTKLNEGFNDEKYEEAANLLKKWRI